MAAEPVPRRFTVDEYHRLGDIGVLARDERTELIEGEIICMPPINGPHAYCVDRLLEICVVGTRSSSQVRVQNPIRLDDGSEPVPDVMLLRRRLDFYLEHPTPPDVMLLIEVSDTTLRYDQRVKVPLYARNGIPEVWVVDLGGRAIYVYREPTSTGYRVVLVRRAGERVGPSALPEFEIPVESILPPIGGSGG